MKLNEFIDLIELWYPLTFQEDWDRSGLDLQPANDEIDKVLISLTLTSLLIKEAIKIGANLILCHHPLLFDEENPLNQLNRKNQELLEFLKEEGIGFYALHTNFDKLEMNKVLGEKLGLSRMELLDQESGLGIVGVLEEGISLIDLMDRLKGILNKKYLNITKGLSERVVRRIALCSGSGKDFIDRAFEVADVYLTGDLNYHSYEKSFYCDFPLIDIGHYESETIGMEELARKLKDIYGERIIFSSDNNFVDWY